MAIDRWIDNADVVYRDVCIFTHTYHAYIHTHTNTHNGVLPIKNEIPLFATTWICKGYYVK